MQVRPHVRKIVDFHPASLGAGPKGLAHRATVPEQAPVTNGSPAVQRYVHLPTRAHGPLDFALTASFVSAMARARDGPGRAATTLETSEERKLHLQGFIIFNSKRRAMLI
jgi:hypothetical protein